MKKFSKVLLILLAVVALMTALAVTALAADAEEETVTRGEPYVVDVIWSSNNYENPDDFEAHVERGYVKNVSTKAGIYLPAKSIDGNRYVILAHDGLTTTSGGYENITSSGLGSKKYNVESYPYMSFDMDVMTPDAVNGYQLTASVTPRFYGAYGDHGNTTGAKVSIGTLNLPATAYEWHHVTIVYKFGIKTVELNKIPVLEYSGYVDGNLVIEKTEIELTGTAWNYYVNFDSNGALNKGVSKLGDCSSVYLGAMVFYATETLNPNDGKTAIDNFKMSAFPEGYTEDEIANYYNKDGGYQPPFG